MTWHLNSRHLIVPGLGDSGAGHWQTHWEAQLGCSRVIQDDWRVADLFRWSERIATAVGHDPRPVILIAHSFGCLSAVHAITARRAPVAAALLVAPADPDKFKVTLPVAGNGLGIPTLLVGSRNDPWLSLEKAQAMARDWGSDFVDLGHAGHINDKSGHGPWPEGLALLERLRQRLITPAPRRVPIVAPAPAAEPRLLGYAW